MLIIPSELETVEKFLIEFRACCPPDGPHIVKRDKNNEFIEKCGITPAEIRDILLKKLSESHNKKEPQNDPSSEHSNGVTYVFLYPWQEYTIYIKLKAPFREYERSTPYGCVCISFHD